MFNVAVVFTVCLVSFTGRLSSSEPGDSEFWTPPKGTSKITFLNNGKKTEYQYDGDDEPTPQAEFKVDVEGHDEPKKWRIPRGKTAKSRYGQLMLVGKDRGGLVGETLTLIRTGEGKESTYTIQEAADL